MGKKPFLIALTLLAAFLAFSVSILAQGTTSRVTGTVTDSSGAAVIGATVTLTNEAAGASLTTETSDSGNYIFDLIQPGTYTVTVEKVGFKKFVTTKNTVLVNLPATVNVALEVGDVSAVVTVEGTAELVQTATSGNVGTAIETQTLESLPIVSARGRNPLQLLNFQPGVVNAGNVGGLVHVHGSRDRAFNFTLDGIDINESTAGGANFTPLRTNPDSLQEFQIVTSNFTAELGRSSGAQVTLTTRSGTNDFHGNLFEFYQTPRFHANEWEFNKQGVAKRQFVQHIFGGSIGGPIFNFGLGEGTPFRFLKDKAFFFVNLQFLRASESRLQTVSAYTPLARMGIFRYVHGGRNAPAGTTGTGFPTGAAVNADGSPRFPNCPTPLPPPDPKNPCIQAYDIRTGRPIAIDPFISNLLAMQGDPNNFTAVNTTVDGLNLAAFQFVAPQTEKQYDLTTRFDVALNQNNHIYFRYSKGEQNTFGDTANSGLRRFPDGPNWVDTFRNPENFVVNYRLSPTSRITNEFIFGRNSFGFSFDQPDPDPTVPFILNLPTDFRQNFHYNARSSRTWQFADNVTFDLSPHTLKFGMNIRLGNQFDDRSSAGGQVEGSVTFGAANSDFSGWDLPTTATGINTNDLTRLRSWTNDLIGRIGGATRGFVVDPNNPDVFAPAGTRWNWTAYYPEYDFYVQDTWKFRPNLTFDLGVRYEIKMSPSSKDLPVLRPSQPFTVGAPTSNSLRWEEGQLYENDYNNFSPSIGFAWDPFKSGKTSVRANYRLSYDKFPSQVFANFVFQSAPGNTVQASISGLANENRLIRDYLPTLFQRLNPTQTPAQLRQPATFSTTSIVSVDPDVQFPESHQWFAGVQREIWGGNVLEVNYIGRRGVHLFGAYNVNQVDVFASAFGQTFLEAFNLIREDLRLNPTNPQYFSPLINALFTGSPTNNAGTNTFRSLAAVQTTLAAGMTGGSVANAALAVSQHTTGGVQTIGRGAAFNNPFFFQPFPQFTGGLNILETNDLSLYNGLEVIFKRRLKQGLSFQAAYTYSVSKDTRSWDPTFATANTGNAQSASSTPFDLRAGRALNYAWSDFDSRHVVQGYYVWELPIGRGHALGGDMPKALDWIVGGWQLSGLFNWGTGRPYTFYSGRNTVSNVVQATINCNGCPRNLGSLTEVDFGQGLIPVWFTQDQLDGISQPGPGEQGNTGRNYFIGPIRFQTDASLSKKFKFNERWSFDLRVDAQNLTNTKNFGLSDAAMTFTSSSVGQINNTVLSFSRRIQFSGKLNF